MLRPPSRQASRRSSFNILIRRPSVEALRSPPDTLRSKTRPDGLPHSPDRPKSRSRAATVDATSGSVRSILRDKNTPNSGLEEPARTRSRAATFDTKSGSVRSILLDHPTPGTGKSVRFYGPYTPAPADPDESFLERLQRSESMSSSISSAMPRFAPPSKSRRSVVEIFPKDSPASNTSESAPDFFGTLDVPPIAPLGLGFGSDAAKADAHLDEFTSTPYKDKDQEREDNLPKEHGRVLRRKDRSQRLPPSAMHDRSHSFSFGQTVFHSLDQSGSKRSSTSTKSSIISDDSGISAASSPSTNGRNRAQSDTGFMSMLRNPHPNTPESALAGGRAGKKNSTASEPDPFSADARTYYTPQTMIPTTPEGPSRHVRQASKEESIIFSLQAQLDMQNELCGQFETDLRAREELVEVLSKKLLEVEQEDAQKRKILRMWKKKVVELERTCRSLEDEVEGSRQESMDRSLMDEASSEALRMLHRQIAALERERKGLQRTEHDLREEVKRLEALVNDKTNEVTDLQQSSADENAQEERSEREAELEQRNEEEKTRHEAVETAWKEEKEDLLAAAETHKLENVELIALLEELKHQLRARDDEIGTLKTELGASGERANEAAKRLEAAETKDRAVESDHESHKIQVLGLQEKVAATEEAWTESERKVSELEDSVQELWDVKEALEVERERFSKQKARSTRCSRSSK
ncbi:hypothetical protein C8J57DRAFT_655767 [Mycena rebaudengoi]|nr:hypothetical protein C8J57DRAFT_655767 [Mycena rebaudengoi]